MLKGQWSESNHTLVLDNSDLERPQVHLLGKLKGCSHLQVLGSPILHAHQLGEQPGRGSGHPGLAPVPPQLLPMLRLPRTDVLLIIVQRAKKCSRLEHIKCLLKKDFMRLVTTKTTLILTHKAEILKKR